MDAKQLSPLVPGATDDDADDSLKEVVVDGYQKFRTIAQRLEKMFRLGENPPLRRKLYIRLQRCAIDHGSDCYEAIRSCVAAAQAADYPDRYFCSSVTRELKALGFWEQTTDF